MTLLAADVSGMSPAWAGRMVTEWIEEGLLRPNSELTQPWDDKAQSRSIPRAATVEQLRELLLQRDVPEETLNFLLGDDGNRAYGSSRMGATGAYQNVALLLAEGNSVMLRDPDSSESFRRLRSPDTGESEEVPALLLDLLPPEEFYFGDEQALEEATEEAPELSFEATVAEYLGRPLSAAQEELILEDASPELLLRLEKNDSRVRAVSVGSYGKIPDAEEYVALLSPERFHASHYVRHSLEPSLHDGRFLNARFRGIDLSEAPPPLFPAGRLGHRGQEEITRLLYQVMYPLDLCLSLPVAAKCSGFPDSPDSAERQGFALEEWTALASHAALPRLRRHGGIDRLGELAHWFTELGSLPAWACGEYLAKLYGRHRTGLKDRFLRLKEQPAGSQEWNTKVEGVIQRLEQEIEEGPALAEEESEYLRDTFRNWGALLRWWPTIWEAARE